MTRLPAIIKRVQFLVRPILSAELLLDARKTLGGMALPASMEVVVSRCPKRGAEAMQ